MASEWTDSKVVEHQFEALEAQLGRLSQSPWTAIPLRTLTTAPLADPGAEAAQLEVAQAEVRGLAAAARSVALHGCRGARALATAVVLLDDRLQLVEHLCAQRQQQRQRQQRRLWAQQQQQQHLCTQQQQQQQQCSVDVQSGCGSSGSGGRGRPPQRARVTACAAAASSAVASVFASAHLCKAILGFVGRGFWLYLSPVSRTVRAMYMEALAQGAWDAKWLFKTSIYAAAQSLGTFQLARKHGLPASVLDGKCACRVVGASRSLELIRAAAKAGMHINAWVLEGAATAATARDVGLLNALFLDLFDPDDNVTMDRKELWVRVGVHAARSDDGAAVLSWVSQRLALDEWPDWYSAYLALAAAACGHLSTLQFILSSGPHLFGALRFPARAELRDAEPYLNCWILDARRDDPEAALSLLDTAAAHGHRHVVAHLRHSDPDSHPYTDATAAAAAHGGHLALLQWLHDAERVRGCPWDPAAVVEATLLSADAAPAQLAWLRDVAKALDVSTRTARARALADAVALNTTFGDAPLARWLRDAGCEWPESVEELIEVGVWGAEELELAFELGCGWGARDGARCARCDDDDGAHDDDDDDDVRAAMHALGCPCACSSESSSSGSDDDSVAADEDDDGDY